MKDIEHIGSIRVFVDDFYNSVRYDEQLAPIFNKTIKDWEPHLQKMYLFWDFVLFDNPHYKGNAFDKHLQLLIKPEHFARWLSLFKQVIDKHFQGPVANNAKKQAEIMSYFFQNKLQKAVWF